MSCQCALTYCSSQACEQFSIHAYALKLIPKSAQFILMTMLTKLLIVRIFSVHHVRSVGLDFKHTFTFTEYNLQSYLLGWVRFGQIAKHNDEQRHWEYFDTVHLNPTNPISSVQLDLVTCVTIHQKKNDSAWEQSKSTTDSCNTDCSSYGESGYGNEKGILQSVTHL